MTVQKEESHDGQKSHFVADSVRPCGRVNRDQFMLTMYTTLAVLDPAALVFGRAPKPVHCGFGLIIGDGQVFPEVNFTLPIMSIDAGSWHAVLGQYEELATNILKRAVALQVPGIVLEFELLPAMTETPEWGAEITSLLHRSLQRANERYGLKSALRVTPADIRGKGKPPVLRGGKSWDCLRRSFELCVEAGADILSIESIGGKEIHDYGLMYGDLSSIIFALGVLAPRDVTWLWDHISGICAERGKVILGGDTACGFANTAMQLAHQRLLPEVLVAVVRAMSAVRSLAAFENGAVGPSKDCAYEGPIIKAITGCPISMEGKSATCAHFSPVGNIAAAMCDLWSNESVQNIRLLSGNAPEAFTELLAYDCRLMNMATSKNQQFMLRDLLIESDQWLSPQAALLSPSATCRIATAIVGETTPYKRTVAAGLEAVHLLREGAVDGRLKLSPKESKWLDRIGVELTSAPASEELILAAMIEQYGSLFDPASYGL
jgi:methanol--5-hydroxybenzimidazolylcobamide Co-methyltransferase